MSNETQKVDVLAELDALIIIRAERVARDNAPLTCVCDLLRAEDARFIIAELIKASRKVAERFWTHMGNDSLYEMTDLRSVLARIGGGA